MKAPGNRRGSFLARRALAIANWLEMQNPGPPGPRLERIWYWAEFNQNILAEKNQGAYIRKCRAFSCAELKLAPPKRA
jgi:hypothetical protein